MTITIKAIRNAGIGCILGELHKYNNVQSVIDRGGYYELFVHENRQIRVNKKDWELTIQK